jgi:hypothetical protein
VRLVQRSTQWLHSKICFAQIDMDAFVGFNARPMCTWRKVVDKSPSFDGFAMTGSSPSSFLT